TSRRQRNGFGVKACGISSGRYEVGRDRVWRGKKFKNPDVDHTRHSHKLWSTFETTAPTLFGHFLRWSNRHTSRLEPNPRDKGSGFHFAFPYAGSETL